MLRQFWLHDRHAGFHSKSASIRLLAVFEHFIGLDEQMLADTED